MAYDYGDLFRLQSLAIAPPRIDLGSQLFAIADQLGRRELPSAMASGGAGVAASAPISGGTRLGPSVSPSNYGASAGVGRGSWYSQAPGWVDRMDKPGSNALGVPDTEQGVALPTRATLGKTVEVTTPDGRKFVTRQTDIGPARWTGKSIDVSAALASKMGYSPKDFPTGGSFTWKVLD